MPVMPGDIIGIARMGYEHYGIYCENNHVIHFTSESSDVSARNNVITETGMSAFMRGQLQFFVLDIERLIEDKQIFSNLFSVEGKRYEIYDSQNTIRRARSMLGKTDYDLLYNNCEHFVMWCKAGIPEMNQYSLFHKINRYKKSVSYSDHLKDLLKLNEIYIRYQDRKILRDSETLAANEQKLQTLLTHTKQLAAEHEKMEHESTERDSRIQSLLSDVDKYLNNKNFS
jgi:hypothetical protein